jgi:hypothetical protein
MMTALGAVLLVGSLAALWAGVARNGEVRPFLRTDGLQSLYTLAMIAAFTFGILALVVGVSDWRG